MVLLSMLRQFPEPTMEAPTPEKIFTRSKKMRPRGGGFYKDPTIVDTSDKHMNCSLFESLLVVTR